MKLYLSGPMSGVPAFNIPEFDEYAKFLRAVDHEIVSPAELDKPEFRELCLQCETGSLSELANRCKVAGLEPDTWGDLLARDVKLLADGDIEGVCVLPSWQESRGALLETFVARMCGLSIYKIELPSTILRPISGAVLRAAHSEAAGYMGRDNAAPHPDPHQAPRRHERGIYAGGAVEPSPILFGGALHECGVEPCAIESGEPEDCDCRHQGECKTAPPSDPAQAALPPRMRDPIEWARRGVEMEADEIRITSETGGQKGSKRAVIGDLCPKALKLVAEVAGFGREKYDRLNYLKGFDYSLAYDAAQRHLMEFWAGNDVDPESGLPHLAHAAWQCLCLLAFQVRGIGRDDRP